MRSAASVSLPPARGGGDEAGVLRPRDLTARGLPRVARARLERQGRVERAARGLHSLADAPLTGRHALAEAAARVPRGVVRLPSALRCHGLTTHAPVEVWLAIDPTAHRPRVADLPLRIVRFAGPARREGVERHGIDGVAVPVDRPAKTVADRFTYRQQLGLDVALLLPVDPSELKGYVLLHAGG